MVLSPIKLLSASALSKFLCDKSKVLLNCVV
jgi:hypothetical protein